MSVKLRVKFTDWNGRTYLPGEEVPWRYVYPFFLIHMLVFGGTSFYLSYAGDGSEAMTSVVLALLGLPVYLVFYRAMFGREEIRWVFINAALGILGIAAEIGWLLSLSGKQLRDYPVIAHIGPFAYYVVYTFLLRHAAIDLVRARTSPVVTTRVERYYVLISLLWYGGTLLAR
jgi:hypothetical protein